VSAPAALLEAIRLLAERRDLSRAQAEAAFVDLLEGKAGEPQIAAFLMGLRSKGETVEELVGCATAMRRHAVQIRSRHAALIDTCGTGGDGRSTANISTLSALVVAGAGAAVAKHGNRSVSSQCGSADLLEALGVQVDLEPDEVRRCLDETGIGFLFAPRFHPAMRHAVPVRRALGVRTILNLLGPLSNPAGATLQMVGVFDPSWLRTFAEVLREIGVQGALVVHGGGMDELDPLGPSQVVELRGGQIREYTLDPGRAGISGTVAGDLRVSGVEESARVARAVLEGGGGLVLEAVALNAGAALSLAGLAEDVRAGVALARRLLREGAARAALERLARASRGAAERERKA
jgi:anthranilate phosphoribosyltransferase